MLVKSLIDYLRGFNAFRQVTVKDPLTEELRQLEEEDIAIDGQFLTIEPREIKEDERVAGFREHIDEAAGFVDFENLKKDIPRTLVELTDVQVRGNDYHFLLWDLVTGEKKALVVSRGRLFEFIGRSEI